MSVQTGHGVVVRRAGVSGPRAREGVAGAGVERRRHARYPVVLGCKLGRGGGVRYGAGATVDVSRGGALLRVRDAGSYVPGESLTVGVGWPGGASVLEAGAMVRGVVTRVDADRGVVAVAIEGGSGSSVVGLEGWAAGVDGVAGAGSSERRLAA